jgi:hypothetical protein
VRRLIREGTEGSLQICKYIRDRPVRSGGSTEAQREPLSLTSGWARSPGLYRAERLGTDGTARSWRQWSWIWQNWLQATRSCNTNALQPVPAFHNYYRERREYVASLCHFKLFRPTEYYLLSELINAGAQFIHAWAPRRLNATGGSIY